MLKKYSIVFAFTLCWIYARTQQNDLLPLKISPNGHYLQYDNDKPFFWLGDTGWELFHRLTIEEITKYLDNRKNKGFNVIQAVIIAELDGVHSANRYGDHPLVNNDPGQPNEKYFRLVDSVVAMAAERGIIMALLPAWGDKVTLKYGGTGPVIFDSSGAYNYGKFLGQRYTNSHNIVWVLGGDRPPQDDKDDWKPIYAALAKGIDDGSRRHFLKTFHPGGYVWESSVYLHNQPWMDFNMIQSGHAELDQPVWKNILRDWHLQPIKPVLDAEPNYEDHPINPWNNWTPQRGYFSDYDVRKQIYRSVFSGACGVTYGHHSIWQFYSPGAEKLNYPFGYWYDVLDRPGAFQAGYLKKLIESRPYMNRVPDTSIILGGQGVKADYITAFRDSAGRYIMVYMPVGKSVCVSTSSIPSPQINLWWFNPKNMQVRNLGRRKNSNHLTLTPPVTGFGHDWVLIIDNATQKYPAPGTHGIVHN